MVSRPGAGARGAILGRVRALAGGSRAATHRRLLSPAARRCNGETVGVTRSCARDGGSAVRAPTRQLPLQCPTPNYSSWELVPGRWELRGSAATDTEFWSI